MLVFFILLNFKIHYYDVLNLCHIEIRNIEPPVPDPGKGVCADPVNGAAILGKEGPSPQGRNKGHQLSPDKGREKT